MAQAVVDAGGRQAIGLLQDGGVTATRIMEVYLGGRLGTVPQDSSQDLLVLPPLSDFDRALRNSLADFGGARTHPSVLAGLPRLEVAAHVAPALEHLAYKPGGKPGGKPGRSGRRKGERRRLGQ
mmetsp:Transcript_16695/g.38653  ORF Transcript_16695/g.38653 Transcript_16695/m.38653 type:complete len:124 (+) Transcript_16695:242-613(+)